MFEKFFGLKDNPFRLIPDPAYLFLSKTHEEALAHLHYAISQGDGFILITGQTGIGKTTICRAFIEGLNQKIEMAYVSNPQMNSKQLVRAINDKFGVASDAFSMKNLIDSLNSYLMKKKMEGKKVVLFIDEAQNLRKEVMEQVRLLSNLETSRDKLLQIVLVGQPELAELLNSYELRQIGQRITVSYRIVPLTFDETKQYILHRIRIASPRSGIDFDHFAFRYIYRYSKGNPKLINIVCARTLSASYSHNQKEITADIAQTAIRGLNGETNGALDNFYDFLIGNWLKLVISGFCMLLLFFILYRFEFIHLKTTDNKKNEITDQKLPEIKLGQSLGIAPKTSRGSHQPIKASLSFSNLGLKKVTSVPLQGINILPKMTHSVQVGAFLFKKNAENRATMLTLKGYEPHIVIFNDSRGRVWYTVRIGNFASLEIAQRRAKAFSNREKLESAVVPVDSL
jgi:type II secretory pathway predicted ATPase ExeA